MKIMITCRSAYEARSDRTKAQSILRDCISADTTPWKWELSHFLAADGTDLYLLAGPSASAAAQMIEAIRNRDAGVEVELWQALDSRDLVSVLFP